MHAPATIENAVEMLAGILDTFGLGDALALIEPTVRYGVRIQRSRIPTATWPELFQHISAQVRAHHEKQGEGGHVRRKKSILEREKIQVPTGPLVLTKGRMYDEVGEYLCREVLPPGILPLGTSRLGGQPDLPADLPWPTWHAHGKYGRTARPDAKLSFLGQINLAELQAQVPTPALPAAGLLLFFYDAEDEPWGFDPDDRFGHRVLFVPPGQALTRHVCPDAEYSLLPASVSFARVVTLPKLDESSLDWGSMGIDADAVDWYDLEEAMRVLHPKRPHHHLLGTEAQVQSGDMRAECQLVSHGFMAGDDEGWSKGMAVPEVVAGIDNWQLLLQFDSEDTDDGLGPMWGDCGLLYFWIEKHRLAAQDFSATRVILQCS